MAPQWHDTSYIHTRSCNMQSHVFLALDPPWLEDRVCPCWEAPCLEEKKDTDTLAAPCPQHAALTPLEAPVG